MTLIATINDNSFIILYIRNLPIFLLDTSKNSNLCVTRPSQNAHLPQINSASGLAESLDLGVFRGTLLPRPLRNIIEDSAAMGLYDWLAETETVCSQINMVGVD